MIFQSVQLNNGKILDGEKIGELVAEITFTAYDRMMNTERTFSMNGTKDRLVTPELRVLRVTVSSQ